jgi:hypothetical protein
MKALALCTFLLSSSGNGAPVAEWPQGAGPGGTFVVPEGRASQRWSVVRNENIAWRRTLPETGPSTVVGAERSRGNGWGHVATQVPTAIGEHLYVPVMGGTGYVLKHGVARLDERALVSLNELGPAGEAWNRASLSFSEGRLFAHTIKEVICIR